MASSRTSVVVASVIALTFMAFVAQAIYGPGRALACSCVTPLPTIQQVASEPGTAVISGVIGPQQPDRTPVQVDTWFWGDAPRDIVWLSFGSQMTTSCDPVVNVGERRVLVLSRIDEQLYSYSPCVQSGVIGTPDGDAALATAQELFGGEPVATPEPNPPPEIGETPGMDAARLYVIGAVGAAALLFGGVLLVAVLRRRRPSD